MIGLKKRKGVTMGEVNTVPELCIKDHGMLYSEWVIGEYHSNLTCPYRIVRAYKSANKVGWEYADGDGEMEDLFDVKAPDCWHPFPSGGDKET